jgi:glycerophosphoryl diester phosphodiesterase
VTDRSFFARGTRVIAHRGASRDCPENTIAAFDQALDQGCDAIELDLQLTRDGTPVVYHDRTLHKISGRRFRVATLELADLRRLDAGAWFAPRFAGQRIPTLAEVLERYAHRTRLLLELKLRSDHVTRVRLARSVARIVRDVNVVDRVFLLCFDPTLLDEASHGFPELRTVANVGRLVPRKALSQARMRRLEAISVDLRALKRPFVATARRSGLPLLVFTCNRAADVDRAVEAGATGLMSDRPSWLRSILETRSSLA